MFSARVSSAAALLLLSAVPAPAQQQAPVIADFLLTIGGDTSMKTVGADKNPAVAQVQPLARDAADIGGHRFFRENMGVKKPVALGRAQAAFEQECQAKNGRMLADDDPTVSAFHQRRVAGLIPRGKPFHFWKGYTSICVASSGHALGGFVAISESNGLEPGKYDGGSQLIGLLMPSYLRTAVYAYHPRTIVGVTRSLIAQNRATVSDDERTARVNEQYEREKRRNEEFRGAIEVGTETNCGAVIQVRGPMVEVAVSPTRTTPNGQSTFWSRKTVLFPPGPTICTFGL